MARVPMVTRTVKFTRATVIVVDTEQEKTSRNDVVIPRKITDKGKILEAARQVAETETLKIVSVLDFKVIEERYGMTEKLFVELAHPLDTPPDIA